MMVAIITDWLTWKILLQPRQLYRMLASNRVSCLKTPPRVHCYIFCAKTDHYNLLIDIPWIILKLWCIRLKTALKFMFSYTPSIDMPHKCCHAWMSYLCFILLNSGASTLLQSFHAKKPNYNRKSFVHCCVFFPSNSYNCVELAQRPVFLSPAN